MTVWLPLNGPNDKGQKPKGCNVRDWNLPGYRGVKPDEWEGWLGLRLDDFIVIDCDDLAAYQAWLAHICLPAGHTWTRKTPHGYHLIYKRDMRVESCKLASISPKLELKTSAGHQIVFRAEGYSNLHWDSPAGAELFDPAWVPVQAAGDRGIPEWSEMPDGIGDSSMISFGGKFREWGMDQATIERCLTAIAEITMTEDPMPRRDIRRLARQAAKYGTGEHEAQTIQCPSCGNDVEVL